VLSPAVRQADDVARGGPVRDRATAGERPGSGVETEGRPISTETVEVAERTTHVLEASGLRKSFGSLVAVDGVSLTVDRGETVGLLGPNGAGKTTTISMMCGLLPADAGEVHVEGERMHPRATEPRRLLGYVPQDLAVYPDLTARENLRFFGRLQRLRRDDLEERVAHVMEVTGLADRGDDRVEQFSGGMKRRLNIGIGLLHRPTLLVLDEPTVGVDPQSRNAILDSIEELADSGLAVLYTTHYMEEAQRLCDRIAIMDQGRVVAEGRRRELIATVGERDRVRLDIAGDAHAAALACERVAGVGSADVEEGAVICLVDGAAAALPSLLTAVAEAGSSVSGVAVREPDLEDVFLHLTGRALRD
jgi:ABC-2 type transport system ATP-binding protein